MGKRNRNRSSKKRQQHRQSNKIRKALIENMKTVKELNVADVVTVPKAKTHRVSLMLDTPLKFPDLWFEVYIAGDAYEERNFANFLIMSQCSRAKSPLEADLVVFTGGPDVDPALYGAKPHKTTRFSSQRDSEDIELYNLCLENGIPMFGVCRGAQFGHVMNGGTLYQDIDDHYGDHSIYDSSERMVISPVSSVHHQMCVRNPDMEVIAESGKNTERWLDDTRFETGHHMGVEGFFYRDSCFLGVQGHPEYRGYDKYAQWCLEKINKYINENPDIDCSGGLRRVKQSLLEERKLLKTPSNKNEKELN